MTIRLCFWLLLVLLMLRHNRTSISWAFLSIVTFKKNEKRASWNQEVASADLSRAPCSHVALLKRTRSPEGYFVPPVRPFHHVPTPPRATYASTELRGQKERTVIVTRGFGATVGTARSYKTSHRPFMQRYRRVQRVVCSRQPAWRQVSSLLSPAKALSLFSGPAEFKRFVFFLLQLERYSRRHGSLGLKL